MIVIVSHPADPHALRVQERLLQEGRTVLLLNIADLPSRASITIGYENSHAKPVSYALDESESYELTSARSVWWRRPQAPDLSCIKDPEVFAFTHNEWQEAINGLWQLLDVPWMNPPSRDEVASRKALQLRSAASCGLSIPSTLITSDPKAALTFIRRHGLGKTIFKSFSCTNAIWRETRIVGQSDLELLDSVRLAPVIFQEYVEALADVRVTIVGLKVFAAAIYSRETDYPADFRMSLGQARVESVELPSRVETQLRALLRSLGLVYGAVDLRLTPAGDYVFFEVNTAGEFLFVEERTGQPIARALADWLAKPVLL